MLKAPFRYCLIVLMIAFFLSRPSLAQFSATSTYPQGGELVKWTITSTSGTTGIKCVDMRRYPLWFVKVVVTGTIQWDLKASIVGNPGPTDADDVSTETSDLTTSKAFVHEMPTPYLCLNIDSCTGCTITGTIWGVLNR